MKCLFVFIGFHFVVSFWLFFMLEEHDGGMDAILFCLVWLAIILCEPVPPFISWTSL